MGHRNQLLSALKRKKRRGGGGGGGGTKYADLGQCGSKATTSGVTFIYGSDVTVQDHDKIALTTAG